MAARIAGRRDINKIRDLVIQEPIALFKWKLVVDDIVSHSADELEVKHLLEEYLYPEAVLQTLRLWYAENGNDLSTLLVILENRGLSNLAHNIAKQFSAERTSSVTPRWFEVWEIVASFTGRENELRALHKMLTEFHGTQSSTKNIVCICGLGGVGKSSLARKYAHEHENDYDGNVIWINAEDLKTTRASFTRLAARLGVEVDAGIQIEDFASLLYEKFEDKKCLLILDNVEEKSHLKQIQPKIVTPSKCTPHVLVTCRSRDLTSLPENELLLGVLDLKEAMCFVLRQLSNCTEKVARHLAQKLSCFPLALQQAVAYIKNVLGVEDGAIHEYTQLYDTCARRLLEDEQFKEDNEYSLTTLTTWMLTVERIGRLPGGEESIQLLQVLSYLNADRITFAFLATIFATGTRSSLNLLRRYCMTCLDGGVVTIHRLVQEVVRLNFISVELQTVATTRIAGTISMKLATAKFDFTDLLNECVSHALQLLPPQIINSESVRMRSNSVCATNVCKYFYKHRMYSELLWYSEEVISVLTTTKSRSRETTTKIKINMTLLRVRLYKGQAQYELGALRDALQTLESVCTISESSSFEESEGYVRTLYWIARTHVDLGEYENAMNAVGRLIRCKKTNQTAVAHHLNSSYWRELFNFSSSSGNLAELDKKLRLVDFVYRERA